MLPNISTYVKVFDEETNWMNFFIEDDELLETSNINCNKVSSCIKIWLDCKPIYNKIFSKSK